MDWVTVDEAALQSGKSAATIRRWCRNGRVSAVKSGRDWLIDPRSMPKPTVKARSHAAPTLDFRTAWRHIVGHDLKQDTWVPDCLAFSDWVTAPTQLLAEVEATNAVKYVPYPLDRIRMPKGGLLTRNAAMPSLRDRLIYQAAIASFADRVEAQTSTAVFSARRAPSPGPFFFEKSTEAHARFQRMTRQSVDLGYGFLAVTDIASYFDNIQHGLLFSQIHGLNAPQEAVRLLGTMLDAWDLGGGVGIPQGPNASRLLGNLYLLPVDVAIQNSGLDIVYLRFQDDIRIAAKNRADIIRAIGLLEAELLGRSLTPVTKKTRLIASRQELEQLLGDPRKDQIASMMNQGLIDVPRKELRTMLDRALRDISEPQLADARFSLWRLTQLRDSARLSKILQNLDFVGPYASIVAAFLIPWLGKQRVQSELGAFLADPDRNLSAFTAIWITAALTESPSISPVIESHCRQVLRDRNQHRDLRIVSALVIGRHGNDGDARWLDTAVRAETDPALIRGFLTALRHRGRPDKNLIHNVVRRYPELKITTDYLAGRSRLPSLVYSGRFIDVPI